MRDLFKVGATGFIWVVFTVLMFGLYAMASDTYYDEYFLLSTVLTGVLAIFAFMLTSSLWRHDEAEPAPASRKPSRKPARNTTRTTKMKREQAARLDALIDKLDDDTLIELETLLIAQAEGVTERQIRH